MSFKDNTTPIKDLAFTEAKKERNSTTNKVHLLEYSLSQDALNVCTFEDMLQNNWKSFVSGHLSDYQPIYASKSLDKIDEAYKEATEIICIRNEEQIEHQKIKKPKLTHQALQSTQNSAGIYE